MSREFGEFLRLLRQQRGLSQDRVARMSGVSPVTIVAWESGRRSPHTAEWQNVMAAINATPSERTQAAALLTTRRGMRLARREAVAEEQTDGENKTLSDGSFLPDIGDLFCALRLRHGWSQTQVARDLGVTRITVNRWENTQSLPGDENLERLCKLLGAAPDEYSALRRRRLEPVHWGLELNLEQCLDQASAVLKAGILVPLPELTLLAIKRQLYRHLGQRPEVAVQLAYVEGNHAALLIRQEADTKSHLLVQRSLALLEGQPFPVDPIRFGILNLAAVHAVRQSNQARAGAVLYDHWLPALQGSHRVVPLCDMALYMASGGNFTEAQELLKRVQRLLQRTPGAEPDHLGYYRTTYAEVLRAMGKPAEGLALLPPLKDNPPPSPETHLTWSNFLLESGDRSAALFHLEQAARGLTVTNRRAQRRWETLAQKLL